MKRKTFQYSNESRTRRSGAEIYTQKGEWIQLAMWIFLPNLYKSRAKCQIWQKKTIFRNYQSLQLNNFSSGYRHLTIFVLRERYTIQLISWFLLCLRCLVKLSKLNDLCWWSFGYYLVNEENIWWSVWSLFGVAQMLSEKLTKKVKELKLQ